MFTRILVPLDGTAESAVALTPAQSIARVTGGTLVLTRVIPRGHGTGDTTLAASAAANLDQIAAELRSGGLGVECEVRLGEPAPTIINEAALRNCDLIVMATHGRGGLGRAILGSVATEVVAHTTTPVLLVKPGGHRVTQIQRILVPVDGTPGGAIALGAALGLARAANARIVLLEVVIPTLAYGYGGDPGLGVGPAMIVDPEWDVAALDGARAYVEAMVARLRLAGVDAEARAKLGTVPDAIEETAREIDADLIVMSTHALTGPARTILGSVADAVVRGSSRGVLVIRRDAPVTEHHSAMQMDTADPGTENAEVPK
jgi:nucleotide-binding universal stress UspA family protein